MHITNHLSANENIGGKGKKSERSLLRDLLACVRTEDKELNLQHLKRRKQTDVANPEQKL